VGVESGLRPKPDSEWETIVSADEGRIFHRRGPPIPRMRSITSIDSRPNEQFAAAAVSEVIDSRNRIEANVDVPDGDRPALMMFSRPFFPGYEARIGGTKLSVESYRGLFPVVTV